MAAFLQRLITLLALLTFGAAHAITCTAPQVPLPDTDAISAAVGRLTPQLGPCNAGAGGTQPYNYASCEMLVKNNPPGGANIECRNSMAPGNTCVAVAMMQNDGTQAFYAQEFIPYTCGTATPPVQCPSDEAKAGAGVTRLIENLTEAGATGVARDTARGKAGSCVGGCIVTHQNAACGGKAGKWSCELTGGAATGTNCTGTGGGVVDSGQLVPKTYDNNNDGGYGDNPAPNPPPKGMCPGEVNGVTVYVKCDSSVGTTATTTTSTNGSVTSTQTTESTTTCTGGTCTTTTSGTTTVTKPDANGVPQTSTTAGTTTAVEPQDDYCKKNPTAKVCTGSKFSGSCKAAFTCEGDAATCAIAQATAKANCAFEDFTKVDEGLLSAGKGVVDGTGTSASLGSRTFALSTFNQTNPYSASCPADVPFTLAGQSVSIPLASRCTELALLGNLFVALTLLGATFFVMKGF